MNKKKEKVVKTASVYIKGVPIPKNLQLKLKTPPKKCPHLEVIDDNSLTVLNQYFMTVGHLYLI